MIIDFHVFKIYITSKGFSIFTNMNYSVVRHPSTVFKAPQLLEKINEFFKFTIDF